MAATQPDSTRIRSIARGVSQPACGIASIHQHRELAIRKPTSRIHT